MPTIPRQLILSKIKAFDRLREKYPVPRRELNSFVLWFQGHKSHLWPTAAERINEIRRELEMSLEPSNVSVVWRDIEGNPDLDDSDLSDP